ncbi:adenine nucleotide transporter BT1, chloroplastic/mitochondrial-like [Rhododendron vialii]|uniref:adenine nucleotide transporter BT1, chloroplastic/mitochondrial-like n=1 Tax=Rhododendron vialii TaxID=182163 RepID=UPI00265DAD11|nr:adenine nucleotide transporter BT1, chloroplastic/mitochondrial-like [Rhododendron vialii]
MAPSQLFLQQLDLNSLEELTSYRFIRDCTTLARIAWFFQLVGVPEVVGAGEVKDIEEEGILMKKKKGGLRLKIKVGNPLLTRLISGAIASAVSMTSVTLLETMMTHLMGQSCGHSSTEVFQDIMKNDGWTGLFGDNLVNVVHVAPSKAIDV